MGVNVSLSNGHSLSIIIYNCVAHFFGRCDFVVRGSIRQRDSQYNV